MIKEANVGTTIARTKIRIIIEETNFLVLEL